MKFFKVKKADIGEKYRGNKNFPLNIPLDDFNKVKENAKLVFDPRTKKEEVWSYIGNNGNLDLFELLSYENIDNKPWVKLVVNNLSNSYYNKDLYYDVGASYDISNLELKNNMKKESAIQQPNKPKPTTTLPDNMQWAWDPNAVDWVAVLKDNSVTTPPLYDPNNQNLVNQSTTSYMSTVKSASDKNIDSIIEDYKEKLLLDVSAVSTKEDDFYKQKEIEVEEEIKEAQKYVSSILDNKNAKSYLERQVQKTKEVYGENSNYYNYAKFVLDLYNEMSGNSDISNIKSASCLAKFLDGPQYSKEIKIEAGLIKEGLVKYAGFDFNRGTKYAITTKGLELLRRASESEHNEALNEREKLAYLFGFNTDEVSTLDTTGKVLKQATSKKWTICEADGTELGEVVADSELDAKVKFGIEHPEYADSQSISAKEIKSAREPGRFEIRRVEDYDYPCFYIYDTLKQKPLVYDLNGSRRLYYLSYTDAQDGLEEFENLPDSKELNAQYEQTTNTKEPYPNPSETPNDHIILENHDGWVNTADQKRRPYTEEEKRMLPLFRLLNEHVSKKEIQLEEDPQKDGNIVATGHAEVINDLEHEVKDLGFHCEPIAEITDNDYIGYDIYSLRIFTK